MTLGARPTVQPSYFAEAFIGATILSLAVVEILISPATSPHPHGRGPFTCAAVFVVSATLHETYLRKNNLAGKVGGAALRLPSSEIWCPSFDSRQVGLRLTMFVKQSPEFVMQVQTLRP